MEFDAKSPPSLEPFFSHRYTPPLLQGFKVSYRMSHVYVLTNQHKQFLSKNNEWIDGRDASRLFRSEHKDVAINQMFEANTRDMSLRIELLECELNTKGHPQIPEEALAELPVAADAEKTQGRPEIEPDVPEEMPPENNPEAAPEPAPEVAPEGVPEIQPEQPDELQEGKAEATG